MIENEFIKSKFRTNMFFLIMGIAFAALFAYSIFWVRAYKDKCRKESMSFAESYETEAFADDHMVYVDISDEPYEICYYDNDHRYYYVNDGTDIYIIESALSEYNITMSTLEKDGHAMLYGPVTRLDSEVLDMAFEAMNLGTPEDDPYMTREEFDNYFKGVALDVNGNTENLRLSIVGIIMCALWSFLCLLIGVTGVFSFNKGLRKLSDTDKQIIALEIDRPETEYIKQCNIFLTPRYLIYADMGFVVVPYQDIIWAFELIQRHYMIPISSSIQLRLRDHSQKSVGNMSVLVFHKKQIINRIFTVIHEKNPETQFGDSQELQNYFYNLKKAERKAKKENI